MARLFCFGFGYSAQVLARRLMLDGWSWSGTRREPSESGLIPFGRDYDLPGGALESVTHILVSIPPDARGEVVLENAQVAIRAARRQLQWIGYLSTTGVYGDTGGAWVDEDSPVAPSSDRTRRRAAAERAWLAMGKVIEVPVQIFRLAGIYGPGRSAFDEIRQGTARRIVKPGHRFGRIHVDDIATVLAASMAKPEAGAIYNVADDEPAEPAEVVEFACELLGVAPPAPIPFEQAQFSPMAQTFWADSRRVKNDKIKRALGVTLAYPSYREGLRAILAAGG